MDQGTKNAGVSRELAALKRAYSLGLKCDPPKLTRKPHIATLREDNVRTGFFERAQFEAVVKHLPEYLKSLVLFFYATGWRTSECRNLEWRQADFEKGWVRLDPGTTKNDDGRAFPFTSDLADIPRSEKAYTDENERKHGTICRWIFHRSGRPIGDFRKAWYRACQKAGVPGRIPDDFRRTAIRNLVRVGVSEKVAMQLTGHKTRSVFERYNIVTERDLRQAARLPETMSTITGQSTISTIPANRVSPLRSTARP
jgi:integrase